MPYFKKKTKTRCLRVVLEETGKAHCEGEKNKIHCKTNRAVLPKTLVLSWRQIFSQILKASAWDLQSFVLHCLWIYFPNTVEFFAFLKTVDPSADTNCCLSYPHWPKSVRIIVFLCKQRIEVNNRSAFTLPGPASPLFSFFFWGGGGVGVGFWLDHTQELFMTGNIRSRPLCQHTSSTVFPQEGHWSGYDRCCLCLWSYCFLHRNSLRWDAAGGLGQRVDQNTII